MQSRGKYLPAVHAIGPSLSSHLPTTYSGNFGAFKTEEQLREKMFPLGLFPFSPSFAMDSFLVKASGLLVLR